MPADRLIALGRWLLYRGVTVERREELDRLLDEAAATTVGPQVGPRPPAWWKGEEHAYREGLALMANLDQLTQGKA